MKASKLIASTAAAFTVVGAIGLAYAQTETGEQNPPIVEGIQDPSLRSLKNTPAETMPMDSTSRATPVDSAPATAPAPAEPMAAAPTPEPAPAAAPATTDSYQSTPSAGNTMNAPADTATQPATPDYGTSSDSQMTERAPQADRN
jgi:hypothetical protein